MERNPIMLDELVDALETNGEISITDGIKELFIETVDDKEGYSYVSSTNQEFDSSRDAVEWAVEKMKGIENIEAWE
jgi:hypothetical protein